MAQPNVHNGLAYNSINFMLDRACFVLLSLDRVRTVPTHPVQNFTCISHFDRSVSDSEEASAICWKYLVHKGRAQALLTVSLSLAGTITRVLLLVNCTTNRERERERAASHTYIRPEIREEWKKRGEGEQSSCFCLPCRYKKERSGGHRRRPIHPPCPSLRTRRPPTFQGPSPPRSSSSSLALCTILHTLQSPSIPPSPFSFLCCHQFSSSLQLSHLLAALYCAGAKKIPVPAFRSPLCMLFPVVRGRGGQKLHHASLSPSLSLYHAACIAITSEQVGRLSGDGELTGRRCLCGC